MSEPPIGIVYVASILKTPTNINPTVLDGGTGFLKVGYAAQVCAYLPSTPSKTP